ncbi:MAG: glycosyltransferase family 39 protein [Chromatiaceae bacterium]|nr:glycosyltransferase family 39 protein [Chromatiaceae bacterium]
MPSGRSIQVADPAVHGLWLAFAFIALWRLWAAWLLPVTQDEAYYFDWALNLDWGYFDHPPGVAWLSLGAGLVPSSALAGRLGNLLAATLTLLVLIRFYRACGLDARQGFLALVMTSATFAGLVSGVLATPDTPLALAWALALHEGLAALRGDRRRWVTAGLATGLGLLGKYGMALIGPVFLWAILWADPKALRTPWPYLGALTALLCFAPNLVWNAQNDWLTIRFQFGHGFSTSAGAISADAVGAALALPERASVLEQAGLGERLLAILSFLGIQAALWGLMLFPLVAGLWRGWRLRAQTGPWVPDRGARALLVAGTVFPLAFFGLVAAFSAVQPNWAVLYLLAGIPLAVLASAGYRRALLATAGANVLLVSLYLLHARTGILPLPDNQQRILRETHGFQALAREVEGLSGPVFADRYQLVAMTRFYAPGLEITQWPGLFRASEYVRGRIAPPIDREGIARAGGWWLLSRNPPWAVIPGFRLDRQRLLYDCLKEGLLEAVAGQPDPCAEPIHRWWLLHYVSDPPF